MLDPWNSPASYDDTVADRYMSNLANAGARGMIHPNVEKKWDEAYAMQQEQDDAPSGAIGWVVTAFCVAIMGFAVGAQALWEAAL